jgi:hypothetical protein
MNPVDIKYQTLPVKKALKTAALSPEDRELIKGAMEARDEWMEISSGFEHVHEEMLVDYYIYRLKACEARYSYYIKRIKERGLKVES